MSTRNSSTKDAEALFHDLGRNVGSVIIAAFAAPPTTPEAAKETYEAVHQTAIGAEESGANKRIMAFYDGTLSALDAFIRAGEIEL